MNPGPAAPAAPAAAPTVLVIGTVDTKSAELGCLCEHVRHAGGLPLLMDVGVLGTGALRPDITNHEVAAAAGRTLAEVAAGGDENRAMALMAEGAALLAVQLRAARRIDAVLVLGGTLGTDLALDVTQALPLGCPKVVLSTVAFSPLLPPERIAPDLVMMLWAGGLHGLNSLCRASLAQAAGVAMGAAAAARRARDAATAPPRPMVGMTSLGGSALSYMRRLEPALAARGYELAVFHTTGMGGRAFEALAARGAFVAVMDFSLQELANQLGGSVVSAGAERLRGAGGAGVPQLVAPGATDMIDYPTWSQPPVRFAGRPAHAHNRLIASVTADAPMRREVAREIGRRLAEARGPACLLLPCGGIEAWDRPGQPLHDPEGLALLLDELPRALAPSTRLVTLPAHINDDAFADAALAVFDEWVRDGLVPPGAAAIAGATP